MLKCRLAFLALLSVLFLSCGQEEAQGDNMAVISAENDFIRVEFHYDGSSSVLSFGESSAYIRGSLYGCIAGGGYFSFYKEKLCQSSEKQWATLVVIPKIPIYTITIEYDCDYEGDNTFGSKPLSHGWYSGEAPGFGRCIWSKETYLRGNADRMELCIWSPPKEGYSTVDDPEEGEANEVLHYSGAKFLLKEIRVEPLERSHMAYTDSTGRVHFLADCIGFQSPVCYTENGRLKSVAAIPSNHPMASPVKIAQCQNGRGADGLGWKIFDRYPQFLEGGVLTLLRYN